MRSVRTSLTLALLIACIAIVACARQQGVNYVDVGRAYDAAALRTLLDRTAVPETTARASVAAAAELRHRALVELRSRGSAASAAADVITKAFPPGVEAVPFYAGRARFNNVECLVLIEAWADAKGMLAAIRLWVIALSDNQIAFSASAGSSR